ncbi:MAG TPA: MqnA/MqnD/SBP family protein [Nitrososphaeraceae archaeon]
MKHISLGHTPDADDAFMFFAMATGKVESEIFTIEHVIEDIETLNTRAIKHELDITAISVHAYSYVKDYLILRSGASFGLNYGPRLISKKPLNAQDLKNKNIAIPGKLTSANLLLNLLIGNFHGIEMNFSAIPEAVFSDSVDAGLVIHEAQISESTQFHTIVDLGKWWHSVTGGLPVPLGINIASKRSLSREEIRNFDILFRKSIEYGLKNIDEALEYSMKYARGSSKNLIRRFVKMYVNELTLDMGNQGERSISQLLKRGREQNILHFDEILFSTP